MKKKKIHFVGIKGVGMTPLAIIAKEAGYEVTGCDIADIFITDDALKIAGITSLVGFSKDHIKDVDIVITTGAHGGYDNPEVKAAKEKNIPVFTHGEALGVFMDGSFFERKTKGISVAGSHGKTTTTAMLATVFTKSGFDASYAVGTSSINPIILPGHYGKGNYFVAEADEYATEPHYDKRPKFLWQHPDIAIFTNIEFDHPDIFPSLDSIREVFLQFTGNITTNGILIACGDDEQIRLLLKGYSGEKVLYGFSPQNDYVIRNVGIEKSKTVFWVENKSISLGEFRLSLAGEHNGVNATAAIIAALHAGIPLGKIRDSISAYKGAKRRLEYVKSLETGALLFDDYAHHPTEIEKSLATLRKEYPKHKIVCIFQPHTYSRTKMLLKEFSSAFLDASTVVLTDIYPSQREAFDPTISSKILANSILTRQHDVIFEATLPDVVKYVREKRFGKDTIIITMGAGDVYKITESLI